MNTLYKKNELWFSVLWIIIYVVLASAGDSISETLGTEKIVTVPILAALLVFLWCWVSKNGLKEKYGLCAFQGKAGDYLWFVPLLVLVSTNLWGGVGMRFSPGETLLFIASMLCVGFLEELIFRGFLFKAMSKNNLKSAVIVSSLTFGIGHIVNLLNGAELLSTLLQICYACAIGFLFTILFLRSRSLLPCILIHGVNNSLSAFAVERSTGFAVFISAVLIVVSMGYALWIIKTFKPAN